MRQSLFASFLLCFILLGMTIESRELLKIEEEKVELSESEVGKDKKEEQLGDEESSLMLPSYHLSPLASPKYGASNSSRYNRTYITNSIPVPYPPPERVFI